MKRAAAALLFSLLTTAPLPAGVIRVDTMETYDTGTRLLNGRWIVGSKVQMTWLDFLGNVASTDWDTYHWINDIAIPAVPFCHLTFTTARPPIRRYERAEVPAGTLGAAFRERRWSRGLEQRQAAAEIGVSVASYRGWETNRRQPDLRHIPAAIRFLGSDWRERAESLGERIRCKRTAAGLSIRHLAALLDVDPTTLRAWEAGIHTLSPTSLARVQDWLRRTAVN